MSWQCPACSSRIAQKTEDDALPRPGVVYRCHVCRLELIYDLFLKKLELAPLSPHRNQKGEVA
jgi:DNA-directed RNA polymerase subunit RPC12/RpoP